jgi:hypothetical protein
MLLLKVMLMKVFSRPCPALAFHPQMVPRYCHVAHFIDRQRVIVQDVPCRKHAPRALRPPLPRNLGWPHGRAGHPCGRSASWRP